MPSRADDIQRVAREYLQPDRLSIVLVGDASVFAKQLPASGFDQFERIPLADLDLGSADLSGTVLPRTAMSRPRSRRRPPPRGAAGRATGQPRAPRRPNRFAT